MAGAALVLLVLAGVASWRLQHAPVEAGGAEPSSAPVLSDSDPAAPLLECPRGPVSVVWAGAGEGVGCLERLPGLLATAARGVHCELGPLPEVKPGDRLEVSAGDGGACVYAIGRLPGARLLDLGLALEVNDATAEDLEALPGIGPGRAAAILAAREAGPFESPEALMTRVDGLGPRSLEALAGKLTVGGVALEPSPPPEP